MICMAFKSKYGDWSHLKEKVNKSIETTQIPKENWINYLIELYKIEGIKEILNTSKIARIKNIEPYGIQLAFQKLMNIESPGEEGILNELLKCGGESLVQQLTQLIRKKIPSI